MRFMRLCAAIAALSCSALAGEAGASIKFIGSLTTDSAGGGSVNMALPDLCYRCRVAIKTDTPATLDTLFQYTFNFAPAHPSKFTAFNQQFDIFGSPVSESATPTSGEFIYRGPQGTVMSQTPSGQRAWVSMVSLDSAAALFKAAPGTTLKYTIAVSPAPEPATWALMILGFLGVGTAMRRRRITPELARYNSPEQAPGRPDWRKLPVE
jgi:hypothetical protein